MAAPLIPQDIYLIERYSSVAYFEQLKNAFAAFVDAVEKALAVYMAHLPADYRNHQVSDQPDVVWGERVLPNIRWVVDGLSQGLLRLAQGDLSALAIAGNVVTAFSSINRDYAWDWMPQPHLDMADEQSRVASKLASNIQFTYLAQWESGALNARYSVRSRGNLDAPPTWPKYILKPSVRVRSGDVVGQSGVYLPDVSEGCAALLIEGRDAWGAEIHSKDTDPPAERSGRVSTTWTLVQRLADQGGGIPGAPDPMAQGIRLRCEGGSPCPRDGWWFAPASVGRQHFKTGELMPALGGDYGMTIWQFDIDQA
jgi:hypothetical protein